MKFIYEYVPYISLCTVCSPDLEGGDPRVWAESPDTRHGVQRPPGGPAQPAAASRAGTQQGFVSLIGIQTMRFWLWKLIGEWTIRFWLWKAWSIDGKKALCCLDGYEVLVAFVFRYLTPGWLNFFGLQEIVAFIYCDLFLRLEDVVLNTIWSCALLSNV